MTEVLIRNGTIKTLPNLGIVPYDSSYSQSVWDLSGGNADVYPFTYNANYFITFSARFATPAVISYELVEFDNKPVTWPIYIFLQARQNTALSPQYQGYGYVFYFATLEQPAFVSLLSLSFTHNHLGNGNIVYTILDMQLTKINNEYFIRCRVINQYKTIRLDGWDESKPHMCTATIASTGVDQYIAKFFIDTQLAATINFSNQENGYFSYNWPNTEKFDTFYMNYANIPSYPDEAYVYEYSTMYLGFVAGWTMTNPNLFTETNYASLVDLCINRYGLSQSTDCVEIASGELPTARFGSSTFDSTFYMW
jgi:hypothetical protein